MLCKCLLAAISFTSLASCTQLSTVLTAENGCSKLWQPGKKLLTALTAETNCRQFWMLKPAVNSRKNVNGFGSLGSLILEAHRPPPPPGIPSITFDWEFGNAIETNITVVQPETLKKITVKFSKRLPHHLATIFWPDPHYRVVFWLVCPSPWVDAP